MQDYVLLLSARFEVLEHWADEVQDPHDVVGFVSE